MNTDTFSTGTTIAYPAQLHPDDRFSHRTTGRKIHTVSKVLRYQHGKADRFLVLTHDGQKLDFGYTTKLTVYPA